MFDDPEPAGDIIVRRATKQDAKFIYEILNEMERSAKERGTGITKRSPQQLCRKIYEAKAVIAVTSSGAWAGFSYFELWNSKTFISNSGLIVNPRFRKSGIAGRIKQLIFKTCRQRYPKAKLFSITTGKAVITMNHDLGFSPVTFNELPAGDEFWSQCSSCVNYPTLQSKDRKMCFCTAMLFDPSEHKSDDIRVSDRPYRSLKGKRFSGAELN